MYWGVAQQHHPPVDWLHLRPVKGWCFSWSAAPIGHLVAPEKGGWIENRRNNSFNVNVMDPICQELLLDQKCRIQTWVTRSTLLFGKPTPFSNRKHIYIHGGISTWFLTFVCSRICVSLAGCFKQENCTCRRFIWEVGALGNKQASNP